MWWGLSDVYVHYAPCPQGCVTCSGQTSQSKFFPLTPDCLTCAPNATLVAGFCWCNDGFYPVATAGYPICQFPSCEVCKLCDSSCLTCSGGGARNCLVCQANYYR